MELLILLLSDDWNATLGYIQFRSGSSSDGVWMETADISVK